MKVPEWCIPAIGALRALLKAEWESGAACPCCTQTVKLRRRRVNRGMAEVLIRIYRETKRRRISSDHFPFIHVERDLIYGNQDLQGARDWQTLRFWGLIEPLAGGPDTARVPGEWRITQRGEWVVEHPEKALLPEWIAVFNNRARAESPRKRSLRTALRRPFSMAELDRAA